MSESKQHSIEKFRTKWVNVGMVYDPDGAYVEWRHFEELLEEIESLKRDLARSRQLHDATCHERYKKW